MVAVKINNARSVLYCEASLTLSELRVESNLRSGVFFFKRQRGIIKRRHDLRLGHVKRSDDRHVFVFVKIQGYVQVEFVPYTHKKSFRFESQLPNWPLQKIPEHTIMLFVCHPPITENNAYAKFWADKQRALWYVMVFSVVVDYGNQSKFQFVNSLVVLLVLEHSIAERSIVFISPDLDPL